MARQTVKQNGITVEFPSELLPDIAPLLEKRASPAVRSDAEAVRAYAVELAPRLDGYLQAGIIVTGPERSRSHASFAYDVYMDPGMNDTFVNITKDGKRYYYPASQEYGFRTRKPAAFVSRMPKSPAYPHWSGKKSARVDRVPGKYFMRTAARMKYNPFQQRIAGVTEEIIKEAAQKHDIENT